MAEYLIGDATMREIEFEYGRNVIPFEYVIRCRDCKHYEYFPNIDFHDCARQVPSVKPDGFCAWGEVRNG